MARAITVENVSKQYRLGQIGTGSLSHDINRWWHTIRGKEDPYLKIGETNDRTNKGNSQYVWSLKDINFDIEQGDSVGIIGRNGAGKSTLLKILSRVTAPTTGSVKVKGRIASLLEVGTGFHPELSGRDNIFLNGAILGMRKHEIKRKFDEIVDFAGVERYIDTPVKRYSSGMYVRLAFAVAAHLESEILIVDEVLAVGDAEFQKKCLGKMSDVSSTEGRTVLFVSHNMDAVRNLCKSGVLLKNGMIKAVGDIEICLKEYVGSAISKGADFWRRIENKRGPKFMEASAKLSGSQPNLKLTVDFSVGNSEEKEIKSFVAIDIKNSYGATIMQAIPNLTPFITYKEDQRPYKVDIELVGLIPDNYSVSLWMGPHNSSTFDYVENILSFEVLESPTFGRTFPHSLDHGFIVPNSKIIHGFE